MKCTNKIVYLLLITSLLCSNLCGCGSATLPLVYDRTASMQGDTFTDNFATPFAADVCVTSKNVLENTNVELETGASGGLFDVNHNKVIYAKNIHERLSPASLTKIMTALVALKHSNTDDMITCTSNVKITESGATLCGLKAGDKLTLNQALHALLIHSANDAGVAIAEHVAGSVEAFSDLMNEEALRIGATGSHFVNPHGLTADEHYTTVYDIYLILNEAMQYDVFNEIIQMTEYSTIFYDADGNEKEMSFKSTNLFFQGHYSAPDKITVMGGKTGTTNAAGSCLALVTKDTSGNPYISVILKASQRDKLYQEMIDLLEEINN